MSIYGVKLARLALRVLKRQRLFRGGFPRVCSVAGHRLTTGLRGRAVRSHVFNG